MNPELKAKWLDALQSGKYKQGHSRLRNADDTYCCLGVLHDVAYPGDWELDKNKVCYMARNNATAMLSPEESIEIGIETFALWHLCDLNDAPRNTTFDTAVEYIKANL